MRRTAVSLLILATGVAAAPAAASQPLITTNVDGTRTTAVDPVTLAPIGRSLRSAQQLSLVEPSPDDRRVALVDRAQRRVTVTILGVRGFRVQRRIRVPAGGEIADASLAAWTRPDRLLLVVETELPRGSTVVVVDPRRGAVVARTPLPSQPPRAVRSGDGIAVVLDDADGGAALVGVDADGALGAPLALPVPPGRAAGDDLPFQAEGDATPGRVWLVGRGGIVRADLAAGRLDPIAAKGLTFLLPSDGDRVLLAAQDRRDRVTRIGAVDRATGAVTSVPAPRGRLGCVGDGVFLFREGGRRLVAREPDGTRRWARRLPPRRVRALGVQGGRVYTGNEVLSARTGRRIGERYDGPVRLVRTPCELILIR